MPVSLPWTLSATCLLHLKVSCRQWSHLHPSGSKTHNPTGLLSSGKPQLCATPHPARSLLELDTCSATGFTHLPHTSSLQAGGWGKHFESELLCRAHAGIPVGWKTVGETKLIFLCLVKETQERSHHWNGAMSVSRLWRHSQRRWERAGQSKFMHRRERNCCSPRFTASEESAWAGPWWLWPGW